VVLLGLVLLGLVRCELAEEVVREGKYSGSTKYWKIITAYQYAIF
jgi:hypothetical protein